MLTKEQVKPGTVVVHSRKRTVYTILKVTNTSVPESIDFPYTVNYIGANGSEWSRPLSEFVEKVDVLFDGSTLAP